MKKTGLLIIIILISLLFSVSLKAENVMEYKIDVFADSNVLSINEVRQGMPLYFEGDNDIDFYRYNRFKAGSEKFYLGFFKQEEFFIDADSETVNFFINTFQGYSHTRDTYNLQLNAWNQSIKGTLIGGQLLNLDKFGVKLKGEVKLITGNELTYRDYKGQIEMQDSSYHITGTRVGMFSNISQQRDDNNYYSNGVSVSGELEWQPLADLKINLDFDDFYSKIIWHDLYTVSGTIDNVRDESAAGEPFFSGYWDYKDITSELAPTYDASISYKFVKVGIHKQYQKYPYLNLTLLESPFSIEAGMFSNFYKVGLGYKGIYAKAMFRDFDAPLGGYIQLGANITF